MSEKAWIIYDARYQYDPYSAEVLEMFPPEEGKPSNRYLKEEYGGMDAVLVECDTKREGNRNLLINHRTVKVIR